MLQLILNNIMKTYKKTLFLIAFIALFTDVNYSQINSITVSSVYTPIMGKKDVTESSAFGGIVNVNFVAAQNLTVGVSIGYRLYSLSQPNQLELWGWDFWNSRYKSKIESDLRADPNLSVVIGSVQKMDVIPFLLTSRFTIKIDEDFYITPNISAGIVFYTRRMYAEETWSKKFPNANYVLTYNYRNFAPNKKGNPITSSAGIDFSYMLFNNIQLNAGTTFMYFVETRNTMGSDLFPIKHEMSINLGFNFIY